MPRADKAERRTYNQQYYAANREARITKQLAWQALHLDQHRESNRAYDLRHKERISAMKRMRRATRPESQLHAQFLSRFRYHGMTLDQYHALAEAQDFQCALCEGEPEPFRGCHDGFHIDHDHTTGKVRGLLCAHCNMAIGMIDDSLVNAERMVAYLRKHGAS